MISEDIEFNITKSIPVVDMCLVCEKETDITISSITANDHEVLIRKKCSVCSSKWYSRYTGGDTINLNKGSNMREVLKSIRSLIDTALK